MAPACTLNLHACFYLQTGTRLQPGTCLHNDPLVSPMLGAQPGTQHADLYVGLGDRYGSNHGLM
jgi:hypothetical protein